MSYRGKRAKRAKRAPHKKYKKQGIKRCREKTVETSMEKKCKSNGYEDADTSLQEKIISYQRPQKFAFFSMLPIALHCSIFEVLGYRDRTSMRTICPVWNYLISHKLKRIIPMEGVQLWLCSDLGLKMDGSKVLSWLSEVGSTALVANEEVSIGQTGQKVNDAGPPIYFKEAKNGRSGVSFDYAHTGKFTKDLTLRTICSVHSFEFANKIDHKTVHGYNGELCNFYIFTDDYLFAMHGGDPSNPKNLASSACAHPYFRNGILKLGGGAPKPVRECAQWTDTGLQVAILTLAGPIRSLKRIGADRRCHHYCGTICELLVYDRELSTSEIEEVETYLQQKYSPSSKIESTILE